MPEIPKKLKGLLKTFGEYTFLKRSDLIRLYLEIFYPESIAVVIYTPNLALEYVPRIAMLKRDNFLAYRKAIDSNFIVVEYDNIGLAEDWVFSFPSNSKVNIEYEIYDKLRLVRNEKGRIK
jgi:hypothetical protein